MKKQVNKNLIWTITLVGMLLLLIIFGIIVLCVSSSGMNALGNSIEQARSAGEIEDVEGYGILLNSIGYGLGAFGRFIIAIVCIVLPGILGVFILLFALIARFVFAPSDGRILAYRILMGFSFAGQIGMFFVCASTIFNNKQFSILSLFLSGYIFFAIFKGMQGTYTKRLVDRM